MATHDDDDDANKRTSAGEKRCFDLLATLLLAYANDETRARRGQEEQERNIQTYLRGKRKIEDVDHECKSEENTASSSSTWSMESKRRRVVESDDEPIRAQPISVVVSDDEPIRAQPIREIKPPVKKGKGPVKQKEPVRREPGETPDWLVELMRRYNGVEAKLVIEKVITKTDLKPDQGRFLTPFKQIIEDDFLNERELSIVEKHHRGDSEKGLDVILLNGNDAELRWDANLRIWEMRSNFNYALCSGWNQFVRENDLAVNQTRRLWSFHSQDGTLFLAFNPLTPPAQDMSLALVPVNPEDPFVCEEMNRRLLPEIPRRSRTPRVWIPDPTSDSSILYLENGFDLNRTPPPEEDTEMDPDVEAVQETHTRWTSQEVITETSVVSFTETSVVSFTETMTLDLELRL